MEVRNETEHHCWLAKHPEHRGLVVARAATD
jgi:hypothetical protein